MKKVVGVLAVALVVLLVLVAALSWFFSGLVLDGAEIKGDDAEFDKEIVSVDTGSRRGHRHAGVPRARTTSRTRQPIATR